MTLFVLKKDSNVVKIKFIIQTATKTEYRGSLDQAVLGHISIIIPCSVSCDSRDGVVAEVGVERGSNVL